MRRVARFETSDGVLHETFRKAERHAEERYGNAVTSLAHRLVRIEKYKAMTEFIEQNLSEFTALSALKQDTVLLSEEDQ